MWRVLEIFKLKTGEKRPIRNKEMCNTTRQNDSIERRQLKSSFAMKKILKKMCVSCDWLLPLFQFDKDQYAA